MKKKIIIILLISIITISGYIHIKYQDSIPVLGYHNIVNDNEKDPNNPYVMNITTFQKQMQYLKDNNYQTLTMDQLNDYYQNHKPFPKKAVVITFDDGFSTINDIVTPILKQYNFTATCFIIGKRTTPNQYPQYLKQDQIKNNDTIQYYSHSYNMHQQLENNQKKIETLQLNQIQSDFINNESIVSDTYFAYPFGKETKLSRQVLKERNIQLAFGYNQNRNLLHSSDQYLLPRYQINDNIPFFLFKLIVK
ncbi:MAG: polysaccharide deacetylase family protein [Erysipelotrichaceae bacterium]